MAVRRCFKHSDRVIADQQEAIVLDERPDTTLVRGRGVASHPVAHSPAPVVVLGANVTGLAVLRASGRRGVPVYCAGTDRRLVGRSRWYRRLPGEDIEETDDGELLASYLRALPFSRTVLFPCTDQWALAVGSLPADVAASHASTVAPIDVLRVLIDKELFSRTAEAHDVPAPRVLPAADLHKIEANALHTFFLKPSNSQLFARRFGVKAMQFDGHAQAEALLELMSKEGFEVLFQEYVPGPPTSHVFLDGYVDRSGVMRACLARRRLRMYPPRFGNTTLSVTIPLDEVAEALDGLRRLLEGLGHVGLFDAEFKLDARDGRFKILEVNARPWWQLGLAAASGVDLCGLAYLDALGEPLPRQGDFRIGQRWVHPGPDLRAWWTGRHEQQMGGFPLRAWVGSANAIFSWDDPRPAGGELARLGGRLWRIGRSRPAARA
jgi:D-aspartate ligase